MRVGQIASPPLHLTKQKLIEISANSYNLQATLISSDVTQNLEADDFVSAPLP
jgi:hypothetical protein